MVFHSQYIFIMNTQRELVPFFIVQSVWYKMYFVNFLRFGESSFRPPYHHHPTRKKQEYVPQLGKVEFPLSEYYSDREAQGYA